MNQLERLVLLGKYEDACIRLSNSIRELGRVIDNCANEFRALNWPLKLLHAAAISHSHEFPKG